MTVFHDARHADQMAGNVQRRRHVRKAGWWMGLPNDHVLPQRASAENLGRVLRDGGVCPLETGSGWRTRAQMAELDGMTTRNTAEPVRSIGDDGELDPKTTCRSSFQIRREGSWDVKRIVRDSLLPQRISDEHLVPGRATIVSEKA